MLPDSGEITNLQFEARVNGSIPASVRVNAFYAKLAWARSTKCQWNLSRIGHREMQDIRLNKV
jgi:hypothetical protein